MKEKFNNLSKKKKADHRPCGRCYRRDGAACRRAGGLRVSRNDGE